MSKKTREQKLVARVVQKINSWKNGTKHLLTELDSQKTKKPDLLMLFLVEFLEKLHKLRTSTPHGKAGFKDVMICIQEAAKYPDQDERGRKSEIAKTILEILEPERVGPLVIGTVPGVWPGREKGRKTSAASR